MLVLLCGLPPGPSLIGPGGPGGPGAAAAAQADDSHAVFLMYHRFGEGDYPSTNIRLEQFENHLRELAGGGYTVLPVPEIIAALGRGAPLPDRALGLTIDDAFLSVYAEAWPRLKKAGVPFTLFVATDAVERGTPGYLSWDQIREIAGAGVTIGNHGASHGHFIALEPDQIRDDLARAQALFQRELGRAPDLFAYPYGEYGQAVKAVVGEFRFRAAFGQQSGVAHGGTDMMSVPRFALNETFGGADRFRMIAQALPLPVGDVVPGDSLLMVNPPLFGFTVALEITGLSALSCFASHEGRTGLERLGESRFEVRTLAPFPPGRSRINCTVPGGAGRWRWFGRQFYVPR